MSKNVIDHINIFIIVLIGVLSLETENHCVFLLPYSEPFTSTEGAGTPPQGPTCF